MGIRRILTKASGRACAASGTSRQQEVSMSPAPDPFVGTWNLNRDRSEFSPHHQPREATMTLMLSPDGHYLMTAEGVNAKGERVHERPQRMIPDGQPYPVPDFPGLSAVCVRPDARTLRAEVRRED